MPRSRICELDCLNCPFPKCIGGNLPPDAEYQKKYAKEHPRTEYFKAYYLNFTEEQKQHNRETALAYYRKNRDRINEAKREKRRLERAEH